MGDWRWKKWLAAAGAAAGGAALATVSAGWAAGCAFAAPGYRGPASDHYDGKRFRNLGSPVERGFGDFLRWQLESERGEWSEYRDVPPGPPPPRRVEGAALRVTFVNHATFLVQTQGLNILTDPIWSERASPVGFAGPKRVRPPGVRFEDLPPIDIVLISHNHYDHLDLPTLTRLVERFAPRIFAGLGNRQLLDESHLGGITELDWWQSAKLGPEVRLHAVPAQHFSGRGTTDRDQTLWLGFVIATPGGSIYFAGDTGYGPHFREIAERLGRPRLALMPIGAYLPRWFMSPVHMAPDDTVRAHQDLGAALTVGMHFGTFPLADDGETQALGDLERARFLAGLSEREVTTLHFGEGREVQPAPLAETMGSERRLVVD